MEARNQMIVRIGGMDYALQPHKHGVADAVVARTKEGAYLLCQVAAVHTWKCVARRWGRRNHHKTCNCGAEQLYIDALAVDMKGGRS